MRVSHLLFGSAVALAAASCSESTITAPPAPADTGSKTDTSTPTTDTAVKTDTAVGADTSVTDTSGGDTGGPATITLKALQDPTDAAHPMTGTRVVLSDTDLVALTPRMLIGSSTATSCRFAVWIGKTTGGDFRGVQVQELIDRGTATNCFAVTPGKIPAGVAVGDTVTAVEGSYSEFCAGPTGTDPTMCSSFQQTQIFLGGTSAKLTLGTAGTVPTPSTVTVGDLVNDAAGAPGPKALALEGTLVKVSNVKVLQETSGSFTSTLVVDSADTTSSKKLEIQVSNFLTTGCVRTYFAAQNGMTVESITGVLVPDFGRWKIRIRNENDVSGVTCATDAGTDGG
jgi:hypothetical protein